MKIGILGGTFDPIHEGHLLLARTARQQLGLNKVLFVPAFIPPHKSTLRNMTPAPYRYRMVELALQSEPGFEITDIELNRAEVSYTVETLRSLKKRDPDAEFILILGADSLDQFASWHEPQEICRMAALAVAPRPGIAVKKMGHINIQELKMQPCPFSSTEVRQSLRRGEHLAPGVLPPPVLEYIEKMNLYRDSSSCP